MNEMYEVFVKQSDGWHLSGRFDEKGARVMSQALADLYGCEETRITPAPIMTAQAWVESEEV